MTHDQGESAVMFRNHYQCPRYNNEWHDEWSAMCDDDCPTCGCRHISPTGSMVMGVLNTSVANVQRHTVATRPKAGSNNNRCVPSGSGLDGQRGRNTMAVHNSKG